jgi:hypothetical protein
MAESGRQVRVKIGFPWIIGVETDDVASLFRRRRASRGPFLLIDRGRGLALDAGWDGKDSVLWRPHALPHQLWYFHRTEHSGEVLIVSVVSGLALDAQAGLELPRPVMMRPRHGESHQRWRLIPTEDGAASFVQSVRTGHVLDVPWEAGPETRTQLILWSMTGAENQQFVIAAPSRGRG